MASIHSTSSRQERWSERWLSKLLLFGLLIGLILPSTHASALRTTRWGRVSVRATVTNSPTTNSTNSPATTNSTKPATTPATKKTVPAWHKWFTLAIIIVLFILMAFNWRSTDTVALMALVVLWNAGIISATDAMSGFSNGGMLTVGVLFVVVHGVDRSQLAPYLGRKVFGVQTGERWALFRLSWFAFLLSAFLNNTPIVAMLTPIVRDWARSRGFHPSTFLIPLSYATAAGGMVTKIGTSTTLVVTGLVTQAGLQNIGFFDIALVALPAGFLSIMAMVWLAPILLPKNDGLFREIKATNNDIVTEVEILPNFPLAGKSAGFVLASLGFNIEVLIKVRRPQVSVQVAPSIPEAEPTTTHVSSTAFEDIFPVDPTQVLLAGDILFLSGGKSKMMEVLRGVSNGLQILGFTADQLEGTNLHFVEVILSDRNPFVGDVVCHTSFSSHYGVSILALRRKGRTNALKVSTIPGAVPTPQVRPVEIPEELKVPSISHDMGCDGPLPTSYTFLNRKQNNLSTSINNKQEEDIVPTSLPPSLRSRKPGLDMSTGPKLPNNSSRNRVAPHESGDERVYENEVNEHDPVHLEVGKSRLKIGDALLLLARDDFIETYSHKPDFILIQTVEKKSPPVRWWDYVPLLIFAAMVISVAVLDEQFDMLQASFAAAALLIFGGWIDAKTAVNLVEWDLLLLIGCMLSISKAMTNSGLADAVASLISSGVSPLGALFVLYIITCIMTEVLSNNGCAGICFPIAISMAKTLGVSYMPFVICIMFGSTTSFLTPIGYQCNMMVWAPGGYSFSDFSKMGLPLNIIYTLVVCLLSPVIWPFNDERYIIPNSPRP